MRRPVFCAMTLALLVLFTSPSAAAAAQIGLETLDILSQGGDPVRHAGEGKPVRFVLTLNNKGDEAFNGPVTIVFRVNSTTGAYDESFTVTNTLSIPANGTGNITYQGWTPPARGGYTLAAYNAADPSVRLTLPFDVQKTEVYRGTIVDRVIQYAWLYAMFFGILVLFVAVVRLRKPQY